MSLHGPIEGQVSSSRSHGAGFIVVDLLIIMKEVVLVIIALVLVLKAGVVPTKIFDPLPPLLHGAWGGTIG